MPRLKGISVDTVVKIKAYDLNKRATSRVACNPQEYLDERVLYENLMYKTDKTKAEEFVYELLDFIINSGSMDKELINKCRSIVELNIKLVSKD